MHHHTHRWKSLLYCAFASTFLASTLSHASGFRVPEVSVTGTATSNALVANTEELGAVAYNPANISFHSGKAVMLGVNNIFYEQTVNPTGGSKTDGVGDDSFLVPNVLLSATGKEKWAFALLVNAPFGLETSWPDNTFPDFSGSDALEPELSRIEMVNFNPNFSYKIDGTSSFAFGFNYYDVRDLTFNTQAVKINGRGSGTGWNIGYTKKLGDISLGASYRSSVKTDIKGTFDSTALSAPNGPFFLGAEASLEFPDILQVGVHYQASQSFGMELDIEHTGWSEFDTIYVTRSTGGSFSTSTNNWKDTWAYRLGFIYKFGSAHQLMFGYSYDETPQPDEFFSARVPDADRQLFSIGASHRFAKTWKIEYAYMHVVVDDRTHNSSTTYTPGVTSEPNGTEAYNGTYESKVDLIGLSISTTF